jgi:predicted O-methyltransferase YrrM
VRTYPASYTSAVPAFLEPARALPTEAELQAADGIRRQFLFDRDPQPYMVDMVRAMRLLRGKRRYVEVGTYDKGCLAYVSTLLAPDAVLVDVDIDARPEHTAKLKAFVQPRQKLVTLLGDSTTPRVLAQVSEAVGREGADCVFVDGNHSAPFAWADYGNFLEILAPGGLMFFHDLYWQGADDCYGVSHAMEWIDRGHPVHVVFADHPVHRFFPWFVKNEAVWGGVGILRK